MHVPALWSSPWELSPSSLGELSAQHTSIQRKWVHNWGDSIRAVSCWECSTVGSVDKWGLLLSLSATLEIFITTTYRPLINYTPTMGSQWIIYMLLISISPIDFCHSFEMDILERVFSCSLLTFGQSARGTNPSWRFRLTQPTLEKALGPGADHHC